MGYSYDLGQGGAKSFQINLPRMRLTIGFRADFSGGRAQNKKPGVILLPALSPFSSPMSAQYSSFVNSFD